MAHGTETRARVPDDIDLFDPRVFKRGIPYRDFERLRAEAPVAWHDEPEILDWPEGPGFWAVTRHEDVSYVSRSPQLFSANLGATQLRDPSPEDLPFIRSMMLNMDPPAHSRLRKIMNTGFTPRNVRGMEPIVRRYARDTIDRVAPKGECDFPEEIGAEFPLMTLAEIMGVPKSDCHLLYEWTNRIIGYQDDEYAEVERDPATGQPIHPRSPRSRTMREMTEYAHALAQHKRERPADDLISRLVHAEVEGERISNEEFELMFFLFTVAGNDTTHSAIPGGMLALLEHRDQYERLLADPTLLPDAIEEMLRYAPPVIHFRRTAATDTELGDQRIARGDKVVVFYPSANRDASVFDDPERFDITRRPNQHVTFGIGPHFCLGNAVARLQMQAMFEEIFTRIPDVELAGPVERLQSNFINGIKHMPVRFTAEPRR